MWGMSLFNLCHRSERACGQEQTAHIYFRRLTCRFTKIDVEQIISNRFSFTSIIINLTHEGMEVHLYNIPLRGDEADDADDSD